MANEFHLMDLVEQVVDEIDKLLDDPRTPLLHTDQLRRSAESIAANICEAFGRRRGPERNQLFRYAHGSTRESGRHLRANFRTNRLPASTYWPLHNRLIVICRMLERLKQG